jgi:hypothetical protein
LAGARELAMARCSGNIAPESRNVPDFFAFAAENDNVNQQRRTALKRAFVWFFRKRLPLPRLNLNALFSGLRGRFARVRRAVLTSGGRSECRGAATRSRRALENTFSKPGFT